MSYLLGRNSSYIILILCLFIIASILTGCGLFPEEQVQETPELIEPPEPDIVTEVVERGSIREEISSLARVAAAEEQELYFTRDGRVGEISVSYNDMVTEGDMLARLDVDDLEFDYQLAQLDLRREELLLEQKENLVGIEISEYDWEIEKINYEKTKMQVERMQKDLEESTIYAPFEGRITSISISETDMVEEYTNVITIADPTELELHMQVSANEQQRIVPGLDAEVRLDTGSWVEAEVTEVPSLTAEIAPGTPDRRIRIRLKNPEELAAEYEVAEDELLEYDSLLQASIILQERQDTLLLSQGSVREYGDRSYVRVIEDDVRREIDVETGLEAGNKIEIIDGLEEGDEVIAR